MKLVLPAAGRHDLAAAEVLLFRDLAYVFAAALLGGILAHAARCPDSCPPSLAAITSSPLRN